MLTTPIGLTNTHSVGVVRDALVDLDRRGSGRDAWGLPVVGETWDGILNDIDGQHVTAAHVHEANATARRRRGRSAEGNVGGGTGMICHGFKGGIGTASRVVDGGWTVGVLLQANHGRRERLARRRRSGGRELDGRAVPAPPESTGPARSS